MDWFDAPPGTMDLVQMTAMTVGATDADPLVVQMREIGFDVSMVATPREAEQTLESADASIAMLGLGPGLEAPEASVFGEWVRFHHPELPVVRMEADGALKLVTEDKVIDDELSARLRHILWRQFYPEWLVDELESYVIDTLSNGFGRQCTTVQIGIKANRGTYRGVVAILNLSGPSAGGRITVHGSASVLDGLADRLGYDHDNPAERAVDLAGEIANQIAGRFKRDLARRGVDIAIGVPVLIEGDGFTIRWMEGRPALHLEALTETGPLSVELCQGTAIPGDAEVTTDLALDDGEFELF